MELVAAWKLAVCGWSWGLPGKLCRVVLALAEEGHDSSVELATRKSVARQSTNSTMAHYTGGKKHALLDDKGKSRTNENLEKANVKPKIEKRTAERSGDFLENGRSRREENGRRHRSTSAGVRHLEKHRQQSSEKPFLRTSVSPSPPKIRARRRRLESEEVPKMKDGGYGETGEGSKGGVDGTGNEEQKHLCENVGDGAKGSHDEDIPKWRVGDSGNEEEDIFLRMLEMGIRERVTVCRRGRMRGSDKVGEGSNDGVDGEGNGEEQEGEDILKMKKRKDRDSEKIGEDVVKSKKRKGAAVKPMHLSITAVHLQRLLMWEKLQVTKEAEQEVVSGGALHNGVQQFGVGSWKEILRSRGQSFNNRTEVDFRDKWRNMNRWKPMAASIFRNAEQIILPVKFAISRRFCLASRLSLELHGLFSLDSLVSAVIMAVTSCASIPSCRSIHCKVMGSSVISWSLLKMVQVDCSRQSQFRICSWNSIIAVHVQTGQPEEGIGSRPKLTLATGLLRLNSKLGSLVASQKVFSHIRNPDSIAWMLASYGVHGKGKEAVETFQLMLTGDVALDHATFTHLLKACSHSGPPTEGKGYLEVMALIYGECQSMNASGYHQEPQGMW
ncbi:unnamed protein product [Linum tenue]|uniref:Pentatricopeptide repeat-containing protein n=1 Tax=Linum tenue TaxID=586396 RepID=A0AAV0LKG9_9ROSI|nr:unnamed protein product [Linum tenue]